MKPKASFSPFVGGVSRVHFLDVKDTEATCVNWLHSFSLSSNQLSFSLKHRWRRRPGISLPL